MNEVGRLAAGRQASRARWAPESGGSRVWPQRQAPPARVASSSRPPCA